mmetsp:Transcript_20500/g.33080  ORF Transcript_20500/g.33080 Transcript_20500/m.33080 type:complete len:327 (-) Transcript_20500:141-1121(-)
MTGMAVGDGVAAMESDPKKETAPVKSNADAFVDTLREEIMSDVEAVLKSKADDLWERGQAEISKMRQDRQEVASSLAELQRRQELLSADHTAMHSALLDITTKLEFVALEMREAIRSMSKDQMQGQVAGSVSLAAMFPNEVYAPPSPAQLLANSLPLPCEPSSFGLQTPPRVAVQPTSSPPVTSCLAPPLPGSPAVLLSLASALPSSAPPCRLHIAECLDADSFPSLPHQSSAASTSEGSTLPSSLVSSPETSLNTTSSSSASTPTAKPDPLSTFPLGFPLVPPQEGATLEALSSFSNETLANSHGKASSGTMRAEAPAFVPRSFA